MNVDEGREDAPLFQEGKNSSDLAELFIDSFITMYISIYSEW